MSLGVTVFVVFMTSLYSCKTAQGFFILFMFTAVFISICFVSTAVVSALGIYKCQNMPDKFPMFFTLNQRLPGAKVYMDNRHVWNVDLEKLDDGYRTFVNAETLHWSDTGRKSIVHRNPWHTKTAVTSITTSLRPFENDADGSLKGNCSGIPCLEGKLWITPNLVFQWTYTNPVTGEKKDTRLSSDEGDWYFGTRHRPLASLKSNGTEVFRAQSTQTFCSAGNRDWDTALVPMGLMLIAENDYKQSSS
jgi:hypothetical protein